MSSPFRGIPFICTFCTRALRLQKPKSNTATALKISVRKISSTSTLHREHTSTNINIIHEVSHLRDWRRKLLKRNLIHNDSSVGLVPTMGALHEGHLALVRAAAAENENVIVSVYVNPTQFGVTEDLSSYPRTWDADLAKLDEINQSLPAESGRIRAVFAPSTTTMYPTLPPSSEPGGDGSFVNILPMAKLLEGSSRPVFFRGVATVCMKLFNLVQPERVYFGQKDAQQAAIIKRMVCDFHVNTEVKVSPTERDTDGLALSSRNVYLGERRRKAAPALIRMLRSIERRYKNEGMRTRVALLEPYDKMVGRTQKRAEGKPGQEVSYTIVYLSLADAESMEEVESVDPAKGAVLSSAVVMEPVDYAEKEGTSSNDQGVQRSVRLIDNIMLPPLVEKK